MGHLEQQLDRLTALSPAELRAEWRRMHKGQVMPPGLGRDLATRALAYRLQERFHGGVLPAKQRELAKLARQLRDTGDIDLGSAIQLKPGTKLVRQWKEHTYQVLVLDHGFQFEGRHYRSLTPIAQHITGTACSGPRFFGLTDKLVHG